jgi:hypothetical protein
MKKKSSPVSRNSGAGKTARKHSARRVSTLYSPLDPLRRADDKVGSNRRSEDVNVRRRLTRTIDGLGLESWIRLYTPYISSFAKVRYPNSLLAV